MSYNIYTTEGLILSSIPLREADRVYSILTKDFGLIRGTATGVRKGHSKLRGVLEPISLVNVSLVRGKEYWRITSAEPIKTIKPVVEILKPLAVLEKLVQGEASNPELFEALKEKLNDFEPKNENFEIKLVAEILFHLGYLKQEDLKLNSKELIRAINKGLEASHLTN